jgi:hypothetical protein
MLTPWSDDDGVNWAEAHIGSMQAAASEMVLLNFMEDVS